MPTKIKKQPSESSNNKELIEIRTPRPGEAFYRTGYGTLRPCLEVQEQVGQAVVVKHQFLPVLNIAFSPLTFYARPVMFHEVIAESGERFAYPQVLGEDRTNLTKWQACEMDAFNEPLGHWITVEQCTDCDDFFHSIGALEEEHLIHYEENFAELLDAILLPLAIDSKDHPVYQRLRDIIGWIEGGDSPYEYREVER